MWKKKKLLCVLYIALFTCMMCIYILFLHCWLFIGLDERTQVKDLMILNKWKVWCQFQNSFFRCYTPFIFITHMHNKPINTWHSAMRCCLIFAALHMRLMTGKHANAAPDLIFASRAWISQPLAGFSSPFLAEITLTLMRKEVLNSSGSRSPMGHKPCDFLS